MNNEPNARTNRDLFREIYHRYGIRTSAEFHCDLNKTMSEEDYQNSLKLYSTLPGIFEEIDKEDKKNEE